jgi:hypothetical protein
VLWARRIQVPPVGREDWDYSMENVKLLGLSKDAALLTYQLVQKGSYKGQDLPPKMNCSAAYTRRGGKWLNISFQQTPAK